MDFSILDVIFLVPLGLVLFKMYITSQKLFGQKAVVQEEESESAPNPTGEEPPQDSEKSA